MIEDETNYKGGLESEEEHDLRMRNEESQGYPMENELISHGSRERWVQLQVSKIQDINEKILYLKKRLKEFRQGYHKDHWDYDDFEKNILLEIEYLEEEIKTNSKVVSTLRKQKPRENKTFIDYLQHKNPKAFAEAIKKTFAKETRMTFVILTHTLRFEYEPPLLIVNPGEFSAFHKAMSEYFTSISVGTRQLYKKNKAYFEDKAKYKDSVLSCKTRIKAILDSIDI